MYIFLVLYLFNKSIMPPCKLTSIDMSEHCFFGDIGSPLAFYALFVLTRGHNELKYSRCGLTEEWYIYTAHHEIVNLITYIIPLAVSIRFSQEILKCYLY